MFIAGGGCLTGESELSRAAARFPPHLPAMKGFLSTLIWFDCFVVQLKRRFINFMRKRVCISGSETLFRPFHVFMFHWLLHGNGRGQLKKVVWVPTSVGGLRGSTETSDLVAPLGRRPRGSTDD